LSGRLLKTVPGAEALALDRLGDGEVGQLLRAPGAVIMIGERLATAAGGLSAAVRLADATGARLAWVPRRAGERGALDAGALPTLLPGGRPVADDTARSQICAAWHVDDLPSSPGRDTDAILAAAADGTLGALLVGGVEPDDLADPDAALAALEAVGFLVSLELRHSAVTERADVVFPIASAAEKSGTLVNWEGRYRSFGVTLHEGAEPDLRVLDALADAMGVDLGLPTAQAARDELISWAPGTAAAPPSQISRQPSRRDRTGVRPFWLVGGCCWMPAVSRMANPIWPARHEHRW